MRHLGTFCLVAAALAGAEDAAAQAVCRPGASTSEARLLAFYAGPLAFSAAPFAGQAGRGSVTVAGDLTLIPDPPASIRHSSGACGFAKPEHSGLSPVFPRPRVAIGLGAGVSVEASWLPPVTVADATPHLGAFAVSWQPAGSARGISLLLRAHTTIGGVQGPITCPSSALQSSNPGGDCYGAKPSHDTYEPRTAGVEAIARRVSGRWLWYAGAGVNQVGARLRVNFTDGRGFTDRNVVEIALARPVLLGGVAWAPAVGAAVTAQLYSVPADATTGRVGIVWRAR
ncbi:MAG: hypothetical protein U9Q74_00215 [Gemmatimonadota bacterium]|nr:hypothetical protein [Gemmatimonadota bacterium]